MHQTAEPLLHPATGDPNAYDRYFFHGYVRDGDLFFGAALGLYPNRGVVDGSVSALRGGEQRSLHASAETRGARPLAVGPLAIEVVEPMRALRVRVASNAFGLEADLLFRARSPALEEPRFTRREAGRLVLDATRYTQLGTWEGELRVAGERLALAPDRVWGARDRSWGIRPLGERAPGPAAGAPQFFWLWAPVHFDDVCTHFDVNEDAEGRRWHENGVVAPVLREPDGVGPALPREGEVQAMRAVDHRIEWERGTRRAARAALALVTASGERHEIALEPIATFQMLGLGYLHPEWGHGTWKGAAAVSGEQWSVAELDPLDPRHLHVQQLCRARWGTREGLGVLEQLAIGPHAPSGLRGLLDGA